MPLANGIANDEYGYMVVVKVLRHFNSPTRTSYIHIVIAAKIEP